MMNNVNQNNNFNNINTNQTVNNIGNTNISQVPVTNQTMVPLQTVNNSNEEKNKEVMDILIDDILPNRFQPRLTFDMEALNELASSIKTHGIIQPLIVRKLQDKYEIIAGERRFKAASIAGLNKVPCIVMNLDDNESAEVAVIENIQRKEMTPLEEAKSYKKILDKGYITQEELAKKLGKNQSTIANKLRLLNLDETVQDAILNEKISERHARSLLKITDKQEQRNMLKEIIEKRLTVRQLEDIIKEKYGTKEETNMNQNISSENTSNAVEQNISVPKAVIPGYDTNENNQQVNIIKNISNTDQQLQSDPINIFKFDTPVMKPVTDYNQVMNPNVISNSTPPSVIGEVNDVLNPSVISTTPVNDILNPNVISTTPVTSLNTPATTVNDVLNPSVFSQATSQQEQVKPVENKMVSFDTTTPSIPVQNTAPSYSMNVDIETIKNNAVDIIKEEPKTNMNALMSNDGSDKKVNRFVMDINNIETQKEEELPQKIIDAKAAISETINKLKLGGIYLQEEDKNLENVYEIVLRLNK